MRDPVLDFIISQTKQNIEFLASHGALSPDDKIQIIQKLDLAQSSQILSAQTIGDPTNESRATKENQSIAGSETITEKAYPPPSGPPPSSGFLFRAKAIWGYNEDNRENNDLSFKPGDTIEVITETNADWWLGRVSGKEGLFPSAYVERMMAPSPPSRTPPAHASGYQPSYGGPSPAFPAPTAPSYPGGPYPGGPPYQPPPAPYGFYGAVNQGYAAPPPGHQAPVPPPQGNVAVQQSQEPPKQHKFGGNLGSTLAHSAVGGVGFGAGSAVGGGIVNAIF
ncbi:hypothetical protein H1R20_g10188, partial [Candolleomyces eurysporus]